jgi:hypothetical protein
MSFGTTIRHEVDFVFWLVVSSSPVRLGTQLASGLVITKLARWCDNPGKGREVAASRLLSASPEAWRAGWRLTGCKALTSPPLPGKETVSQQRCVLRMLLVTYSVVQYQPTADHTTSRLRSVLEDARP